MDGLGCSCITEAAPKISAAQAETFRAISTVRYFAIEASFLKSSLRSIFQQAFQKVILRDKHFIELQPGQIGWNPDLLVQLFLLTPVEFRSTKAPGAW